MYDSIEVRSQPISDFSDPGGGRAWKFQIYSDNGGKGFFAYSDLFIKSASKDKRK